MNDIFKNLLDNYLLISYHIKNNNYYYYKMVTKGNYLYMDTIVYKKGVNYARIKRNKNRTELNDSFCRRISGKE